MSSPTPVPGPLKTPDPAVTPEVIIALLTGLAGNLVVLFGLNLTADYKAAVSGTITTVVLLGVLAFSAFVRGKRASAGGVVGGFLLDVPQPDGNDTQAERKTPPRSRPRAA